MNERFFLFNDAESGEEFFVQAGGRNEAKLIAMEYFESPKFVCEMSEAESEWYPFDVY